MCGVCQNREAFGEQADGVGDIGWSDDGRPRREREVCDGQDEPVEIVCAEAAHARVRFCFGQAVFGPTQHIFDLFVGSANSDERFALCGPILSAMVSTVLEPAQEKDNATCSIQPTSPTRRLFQ